MYIDDVVNATQLALDYQIEPLNAVFNVGTGIKTTVIEIANVINDYFGGKSSVSVTGKFRVGDIRHNVASMDRIRQTLGFEPKITFAEGIGNFLDWASGEEPQSTMAYQKSVEELRAKGLMGGA